ncbi:MAG: PilN domain-containing protein [Patescibacteria group bacterium]|nr:PilN domain-containing protein [Patescibacteria group bacterium]
MNNLNLLPPEIKDEINYAKKNAKLVSTLTLLLSVCIVFFAFFLVLIIIINDQKNIANIEKEFSTKLVQDKASMEQKASDLSKRLVLVKKLKDNRTDWDTILKKITESTPAGLQLQSVQITNNEKNRAIISGIALSDRDIVLFKDLLTATNYFKYVDIESITENGKAASGADQKVFVLSFTLSGGKVN